MSNPVTIFERRQRLVELTRRQPGIRVPELANALGVSQGTVRNDLHQLAGAGRLRRVRGGAVPQAWMPAGQEPATGDRPDPPDGAPAIARWAAELVQDGDTLLLDQSAVVYQLALFLRDSRSRLSVLTNGIGAARALAGNPTNTVILLGGVISPDGLSISGSSSERMVKDLRFKLAFISCSGVTFGAGLSETDIAMARLKTRMIAQAQTTVALVEAHKFDRAGLLPFAPFDRIHQLFTGCDLRPEWIAALQQQAFTTTLCGEGTATTLAPVRPGRKHWRIGFANLSEQIPFAVDVRLGLEQAAQAAGDADLILTDNQLSRACALQAADYLLARRPDLIIEFQLDEHTGELIMEKFRLAGIPVIAVDIPLAGATYFGADNYRAGYLAGQAVGQWIRVNWQGQVDRVVILDEPRVGSLLPAARIRGQIDGLQGGIGEIPAEKILRLNGGNRLEVSQAAFEEALRGLAEARRLAVLCFNDDTALGAIAAARAAGREQDIIAVGQGADRRGRAEIRRPGSRLLGSTAYWPERYGERLFQLARQLLEGAPTPPAVYVDHIFITRDNINQFYPE